MEPTVYKGGKIKRSWQLTKSSWQVLKLDKELVALPALSTLVSISVLIVLGIIAVAYASAGFTNSQQFAAPPGWLQLIFLLIIGFVLTLITNIFSGAIVWGAIERFRGGDPTVRRSLGRAMSKFQPLALFSLLMATIGLALQVLEDRVPFAGKIAVWLVSASWQIANVFAVPVIVMSDQNIAPFDATKQSVAVIRKVWGEGVVAQFGVAAVAFLATVCYLLLAGATVFGSFALTHNAVIVGSLVAVAFIGMLILSLVFSALASIMKAALYYYAVTGQAPEKFNQELLRTAMTPKKARKIFA